MTRIAATIRVSGIAHELVSDITRMLRGRGEGAQVKTTKGFAAGLVLQGPGGIARHGNDVLALDGVFYESERLTSVISHEGRDAEFALSEVTRDGVESFLKNVIGDFSLVWFDARDGSLWLARDHFGMRPLYYARLNEGWAVASQPGMIMGIPEVSGEADPSYVVRFGSMHYRMIDNDPEGSPFRDIKQVPSATTVHLMPDGTHHIHRYWTVQDFSDFTTSTPELAEQYRELLQSAVSRRLARYPRRAFTLSGGMDSSSVLAFASLLEGAPQVALSGVYDDPTYDERTEIADMLAAFDPSWIPITLGSQLSIIDEVDSLIAMHDEPVATATWLSHKHICEAASGMGFDSLFGGLGGDELNAGEYEYFPFFFADVRAGGDSAVLESEISSWIRHHDHPIFRKTREGAFSSMDLLTVASTPGLCRPDLPRMLKYTSTLVPELRQWADFRPIMESPSTSYLKNRTWQDLTRETIPCCLRAEDRHGANYGLPPVLPFLDRPLVEFMYRVSSGLKTHDGVTKRLLRLATQGVLPDATRARVKKTGWNAPAHLWFVGRGADAVRDLVSSDAFRSLGIYDGQAVLATLAEHEEIVLSGAKRENHMMFLWQFTNLVRWEKWRQDLIGSR